MPSNFFSELVKKSGLTLKNKENVSNILNCDQAVFQKNLRASLLVHPRFSKEESISTFINDFEKHIEDEPNLKSSLLYTQTSQTCSTCRGGQQDSLIRILLNIDELQSKTVSLLIEKFLELVYENENVINLDVPRLILANLRWLDHIVDSTSLTDKVIDLLQGSPLEIQKEIICFLPDIVDGENHFRVAEILCDLYESSPELTCSILDTLSYLSLESDTLLKIHTSVLDKLHVVKPENLPIVIKFLLNNTTANNANKVVSNIRAKIPLFCKQSSASRTSSSQRLSKRNDVKNTDTEIFLFSNIKTTTLIHKYLGGAWLKAISDISEKKLVKHFDLLVLLIMYQHIPSRRNGVESVIRNMIRLSLFTTAHLESTFQCHVSTLKECFEAVKKLADNLLRSSESEISRYGSHIYRCSFAHLGSYQQEEVILSLLSYLGDNEIVRQTALSLMSQLAHEYPGMENFLPYLKGSLDIMETLSLREAKLLMDVLLHLAYSNPDEASSRDELVILIRKQLSHSNIKYKRLGVLSAVLTLKNSATDKDSVSTETSIDSESDIKEAEALFNAVRESTANSPYSSALFMDELATSILKTGFSMVLEKWISEKVIGDFEKSFIVDCELTPTDNLPCSVSYQWNLDDVTDSEKTKSIAVCIAQLVLKATETSDIECSPNIVTLAPHFRLMRMVESHLNEGDLGNIDALLGCGLQMPSPSIYEKFSTLSDREQTILLSSLFYAVNWFRELINAFATQKDKDLRRKVVFRLRKTISLQDLLLKLLRQKPAYTPPPAVFDLEIKHKSRDTGGSETKAGQSKSKKGKKRKLSDGNDTCIISQTQNPSQKEKNTMTQVEHYFSDLKNYKAYLRELHLDVFNLLFRNLCVDSESNINNDKYLFVAEAGFLISDLNEKLSRIFVAEAKKTTFLAFSHTDQDIGFSHFDVFTAKEVAEQAIRYIKPVCAHLEVINHFFQELLSDDDCNDEDDTSSIINERTLPVSDLCTSLFLTLKLLLSWSSLHLPEHSDLLTNILKLFAKKLEGDSINNMTREELISASFRYLSGFSSSVISISSAAELVELLDSLIAFTDSKQLQKKLFKIIDKILRRNWDISSIGSDKRVFYSRLHTLLKLYFCTSDDPLSVVHSITSEGIKEVCESKSKEAESKSYPLLKKSTLHIFYGVLLKNLVSGTKKLLETKSNNFEILEIWNVSVKALYLLTDPLKSISSNILFSSCLQHSKNYMELFLQEGMPIMDKCLQKHQKEVTALLKNLQFTTRFLHHLCTHAKCNQDARLVRYVPIMKRSLEAIVFRVKAMLTLNNCQSAFWLGNLKNRDLQGEELLSQSATESEETDNEDNVPEEVLSDVDLDEENEKKEKEKEDSYSMTY